MRCPRIARPRRRGAVVVQVAVASLLLLSCVALAVDLGYIRMAYGEMQRAADSSALAGASGVLDGGSAARLRAIKYAGENTVARNPVVSQELDIALGNWSGVTRSFTQTPDEGVDGVRPNAVRVVGTRSNLGLFFAPVVGVDTTNINRHAVALVGSGTCAGIWGLEGVILNGDILTDSYDSTEGSYGPGNIRPNGDVCSCRDIVVNGSANIHGDAIYGEGYAFIPHGTSYEVLGLIDYSVCGTPSFDADFERAAMENDNETIGLTYKGRDPFRGKPWDLTLAANDHLTLYGGTYYFTSAKIASQAYIEIDGPTTIYVDGPAFFTGGGLVNSSEDPYDLIIYANGDTVDMSGNSEFYGAVIAPESEVLLHGTSDFYGTILSRVLNMRGDPVIHVDEGLVFDLFGIRSVDPVLVE
ncbi:MAG: TadG family pilus assembly protein [Planctomycetota bacterium]